MLLRLGFAILAIAIPSATVMSRWVIVVLVPIGSILIVLSGLLRNDPVRVFSRLAAAVMTIPGMAALLFASWIMLSLAWTPEPAAALDDILKTLGLGALGFLAVASLPQRMRASNLHLVTIGLLLGAALVLFATLTEALGWPILKLASATPARASVLLTLVAWPAAAWMLIKDRRALAAGLLAAAALVALVGPAREAILPFAVGLMVLAASWTMPERVGRLLAALVVVLILLWPALPYLAGLLAKGAKEGGILAGLALWGEVFGQDLLRSITGYGFDAATAARTQRWVPGDLPFSFLADFWFELGLLGAVWLAILAGGAFLGASRLGYEVAPMALAGLSVAVTFSVIEPSSTQTWWANGLVAFALVLASVERGRYRTMRPRAPDARGVSTGA